jgi:hypothetical protein
MSEVPDSVTADELLKRIRQLRSDGGLPPRATTLPSLPLSGEGAGMLDLTVVLEQLILDAGGVSMLQMLHLTSFLFDAVIDGIHKDMQPYADGTANVNPAIAQGVFSRASADIAVLSAAQGLLHSVLTPLTCKIGQLRATEVERLGHEGLARYRRVLVSDALVESLGIGLSEFDAYFRKRFGPELGTKH